MNQQKKHRFSILYNRFTANASYKTRLFLAFLLIAVPILIVLCVGSFLVLRTSSDESLKKTQATQLERVNTQLTYMISDTENMSREIIFNSAIQQLMSASYNGEQYPNDTNAAYYIQSFLTNRDFIDCVVLAGTDHTIFSTERAFTDVSAFQNICAKWWYSDLCTDSAPFHWYNCARMDSNTWKKKKNTASWREQNSLVLARPIYNMEDNRTLLGYMMIYLDEDYLKQALDSVDWGKTSNLLLLDSDLSVLARKDTEEDYSGIIKDTSLPQDNIILSRNSQKFILSSFDMSLNQWKICMITPYREVDGSVRFLKIALTVLVCVILLTLFLMSKFIAGNMAQPIILLSELMDSYHGKKTAQVSDPPDIYRNRTDEVGRIYRSYQQMVDRMNRLIKEIYVKNLEKKDAELALLQSQINPHFLYNTLDSINWMALANDQDEISEMITALSDTFRLSLMKNNSSFVEIDQEIQYIKSYLILQKFRYGERLQYSFDLPEPLPRLFIPRFILQPVVENSLKHGIDSMEQGGSIFIQLEMGNELTLTVRNDGTSIDLEKMEQLLFFDPRETDLLAFQKGGYGVQNIHRRIKIICGDDYGLSYEVTDTQTICRILLPIRKTD